VPLMLEAAGLGRTISRHLGLDGPERRPDLDAWRQLTERMRRPKGTVPVALVGKYVQLPDAYLSVMESLRHAGFHHDVAIDIRWVSSERVDQGDTALLKGVAGIVVPGGFGHRGVEGKIVASRYAPHNRI